MPQDNRVPKSKLSLSLEGLTWANLAEHLRQISPAFETSEPVVGVTLIVGGHVLFVGELASSVHQYPAAPPHVIAPGGLVRLDAIAWDDRPVVEVPPPGALRGGGGTPSGGGSAKGPN